MAAPYGIFGSRIQTVKVFTKDVVNGLEITYVDDSGNPIPHGAGSRVGDQHDEFTLEHDESINLVSWYYKNYHGQACITQVTFKTNSGKTYGPYGPGGGDPSSVTIKSNPIIGFISLDGQFINYIAACLPLN